VQLDARLVHGGERGELHGKRTRVREGVIGAGGGQHRHERRSGRNADRVETGPGSDLEL